MMRKSNRKIKTKVVFDPSESVSTDDFNKDKEDDDSTTLQHSVQFVPFLQNKILNLSDFILTLFFALFMAKWLNWLLVSVIRKSKKKNMLL